MRSEQEVRAAIEQYSQTVRRLCLVHLKNREDTEDILQTVFMKYACHSGDFESPEHEKAWIIRVTINQCRDLLRKLVRRHTIPIEQIVDLPDEHAFQAPSHGGNAVLEALLKLPEKYKVPMYLFYVEGYSAVEIGKLTKRNVNTVYTALSRGREMLGARLRGGEEDD